MKKIILNGVVIFCFFYGALVSATDQNDRSQICDIHLQTQKLQREVDRLRAEVCRLEHRRVIHPVYSPGSYFSEWFKNPVDTKKDCESIGQGATEAGISENNGNSDYTAEFARMWGTPRNLLLLAAAGATVTTSPFLGLRSAFDASDLIINLPTMNEDLRFLKEHVLLEKKLKCYGVKLPDKPIVELGGKIEGIVFALEDYNQGPTTSDVDLASVRLDVLVQVSRGVQGFVAFNMDTSTFELLNNSSLDIQLAGQASRVFNSRVFVSRAFVTLGDLDCFPLYLTIGQMFVPFGRYASNMITSPLTVDLGRTNERALLFGVYKNGIYGSVYGFRGEAHTDFLGVNVWGTNWGYEKTWKKGSLNVGAGYISNIADSSGMQITGASRGFFGFGSGPATEFIFREVPAIDVHGEFAIGQFNIFSEYIWTTREFDVENLNFNGHGAKPSASNLELAYNFKLACKPASLAVGYGVSSEALALNLPKSSFLAAFNISIWKDTIESLEFRHDDNYSSSDTAGGNGAIPFIVNARGGSRNAYTAQIGIYF